ncbi:hypothetical protein DFJ77DRAFT_511815 [Powellomyces hirtus]|nr:hypothetical protein DFJ77DRAFT_511815 [Powellomyces hirtus]
MSFKSYTSLFLKLALINKTFKAAFYQQRKWVMLTQAAVLRKTVDRDTGTQVTNPFLNLHVNFWQFMKHLRDIHPLTTKRALYAENLLTKYGKSLQRAMVRIWRSFGIKIDLGCVYCSSTTALED